MGKKQDETTPVEGAAPGEPTPADDPVALVREVMAKLTESIGKLESLETQIAELQSQMEAGDTAVTDEVASKMATLQSAQSDQLKSLSKLQLQLANLKAGGGVGPLGSGEGRGQTPGEQVVNHEGFKALAKGNAKGSVSVPIKGMMKAFRPGHHKAEYSGIDAASAAALSAQFSYRWEDFVVPPELNVSLRDLMNVVTVDSDLVEFIEETGYHELRTALTVAAVTGDTTLAVENANGFYAGQEITISDATASQTAEVQDVAVGDDGDAGVITLTAPLTGAHTYAIGSEVTSDTFTFTADTNLKPSAKINYAQRDCSIRTLATSIPLPKRYLADFPVLRDRIDNRLLYGLMRSETQQILYGSGLGTDLLGIMNNPAILTYLWSSGDAGDTMADAILEGITLAALSGYAPNAVLLNPADLTTIKKAKGTDGHYLVKTAFEDGAVPKIWGVPVVENVAIRQGEGLVGDFRRGATLWDREAANVQIATQHEDHFLRNMVDLLAEERICVSTELPEAFVKVTFDHSPDGGSS